MAKRTPLAVAPERPKKQATRKTRKSEPPAPDVSSRKTLPRGTAAIGAVIGDPDVRIEYVPLGELKRWPKNPKLHDLDGIGASIERFGFVQPILVDETTGKIVAGHGRLETLQKMKAEKRPPPGRVKLAGGEWMVPVLRGIGFDDEKAAQAYLIADNRMVELGGWDEKLLAESFEAVGDEFQAVTGWSQKEIDKMLALAARSDAAADRALTTTEQEGIYLSNGIRQVVFHMTEVDYKRIMELFERLSGEWNVPTNAGVFLRMCDEHAAA